MNAPAAPRAIDDLLALLDEGGDLDDDEHVSVLEHSLQCADRLAEHGRTGADTVRLLVGARVAWLVAEHVTAKRYLVATDPSYRDRLSARSTATLGLQGDALGADERHRLEQAPDFAALIALRRADEAAKVPGRDATRLDDWWGILDRLAREGHA